MQDTEMLSAEMAQYQQHVLDTCDAAIKIRNAPYHGQYAGKRPISIGAWIDSMRGYIKTGRTTVTHTRENGTAFDHNVTFPLADYRSWLARVSELFLLSSGVFENGRVLIGLSRHDDGDAAWRQWYDDELSPPDAIGAYCEDLHDMFPDTMLAQMVEVCGDWIVVGRELQALLDAGMHAALEWSAWLTAVDRLWLALEGKGAFVSPEMLSGMSTRFNDGKCPVEALGFYIFGRCMGGSMPAAKAARYLNALRAGSFDIPGYQETGGYCPAEDRHYTQGSLQRLSIYG